MELNRNNRVSRFLYVGIFLSIYVLAAVATVRFLVRSGIDVAVPSLVGLHRDEAETLLGNANLRLSIQGELWSAEMAAGRVLQQSIAPSERVREGRSVGVFLSKGPMERSVPRLTGLNLSAVSVVLGSSELKLGGSVRSCSDTVPAGLVIGQEPGAGERMADERVRILVSNGKCSGRFVMPDFVGQSYGSTARLLEERGFSVGLSRQEAADSPEGTILGEEPERGSLVSLLDPVHFVIASRTAPAGQAETAKESHLVYFRVPSSPSFFRRQASIRIERGEPFGSSSIDFLLTPGKNSHSVLWLPHGSEVVGTVDGKEVLRKTYE